MLRNALSNTHDERNLCLNRFLNASCCYRRRDEDGGGIGAGLFDGVRDVGEDGAFEVFGAGFFGVRAAYYVRAVFDCLGCVEGALSAGLYVKVSVSRVVRL